MSASPLPGGIFLGHAMQQEYLNGKQCQTLPWAALVSITAVYSTVATAAAAVATVAMVLVAPQCHCQANRR